MNLIPACRATSTKCTGLPDGRADRPLRLAANAAPAALASIFRRVHPRSVLIRASLHHRRLEGHPKNGLDTAYHVVYNRPEGVIGLYAVTTPNLSVALRAPTPVPRRGFSFCCRGDLMSRFRSSISLRLLATCVALLSLAAPGLWAQSTQGAISITVTDPAGAVVPGAKLELRAAATNDLRTATTQEGGAYRFVGLSIGNYGLTVTREGFAKVTINPVVVEAARVTDVSVALKVGGLAETVEVTAGAEPVLETSSNMIGTTIDVKQIEDLPLGERDLTQLSHLAPGYNGTWNGLPVEALGNNFDGVASSSSRMKVSSSGRPTFFPASR